MLHLARKCKEVFISITILTAKALFLAKELGCNNFYVSDGWLNRWKERNSVSFKAVSGIDYKKQYLKRVF